MPLSGGQAALERPSALLALAGLHRSARQRPLATSQRPPQQLHALGARAAAAFPSSERAGPAPRAQRPPQPGPQPLRAAGGRRAPRRLVARRAQQPGSGNTPGNRDGADGSEGDAPGGVGDWEWPGAQPPLSRPLYHHQPPLDVPSPFRNHIQSLISHMYRPLPTPAGGDYDSTENIPGAFSARTAWNLSSDAQGLFSLFFGFTLLPLVLSTCLRVAIIDPLVFLTLDLETFELNEHQRMEIFEEVDRSEARLRYDILMGRHAPMTIPEIEEHLTEESVALETEQRVRSRQVVVNSISDSLCFALLVAGVLVNRKRVRLVRQGVYKKFLRLPPSAQAIAFLLLSDIVVGYHSSDGWITFVEMFMNRYTISGAEENEKLISLFVAVVPVVADVAFKFWVYKYLRKLSPGTQIIMAEMDG